MSGHSHWAGIKHKKELTDKKKGKIFSKMAKMIAIAAREGGDPDMNPSLRLAVEKARSVNMPNENIKRAIRRGTGEIKEAQLEEVLYEAYGPGGSQIILEVITDNKNRTVSELRHVFNQYNGRIAESGGVKWNFNQMGVISIDKSRTSKNKEELELSVIDAGADDIKWRPALPARLAAERAGGDEILEIYTKPENLEKIKENLNKANIKIEDSGLDWVPKNEIEIKDQSLRNQLEKLFEALDENEDVNEIYSNVNL